MQTLQRLSSKVKTLISAIGTLSTENLKIFSYYNCGYLHTIFLFPIYSTNGMSTSNPV